MGLRVKEPCLSSRSCQHSRLDFSSILNVGVYMMDAVQIQRPLAY
jgi:hypothetical protein